MNQNQYDAIIIGAGMSGLAAGIRLSMFDKKVLVLEKHTIAGGLNSYYQRKNQDKGGLRKFDVGLHALTNFVPKGAKGHPLTKLLKQLRIPYDSLDLEEQSRSLIKFPDHCLAFSNDFELLLNSVNEQFPSHTDEFLKLVDRVRNFNELDLSLEYTPAKEVLRNIISNCVLVEMLMAPLLIYGSAWEDDMDFAQFVVMFKSLYFEGFARPKDGVRVIINTLLDKLKTNGAELKFKSGVDKIITKNAKAVGVKLLNGEEFFSDKIFSSAGLPETLKLVDETQGMKARVGNMSFMESIIVLDKPIKRADFDPTIVFYNNSDVYRYRKSEGLFDKNSAVVCFPDNYGEQKNLLEGQVRVTYMANYDLWKELERSVYLENKELVFDEALKLVKSLVPNFDYNVLFHDVFSPTTVERYTWHEKGTVYGSVDKLRDGKTKIDGLYIIGTDQGFLGIVGSMLSGISMANLYGLMES